VAKKIGQLADNLARTSESLSQIAKSLEQGEGTVGALLQDPSLYEDLKIILGGAKRSEALRYVIQHSIRQKQREAEKKKKSGAPAPQGEGGQ
jgi:phospholipid/cholesterol/gamma-HCH transport system substrate-binding protein